jgi:pimeloyl-ACP methyl ester carboxylesterase
MRTTSIRTWTLLASLVALACSTAEVGRPATEPTVSVAVVPAIAVAEPAPEVPVVEVPAPLQRHTVEVEGHPIAVWEKSPAEVRRVIVMIHGRTWSARPDFDLQVAAESRSLMDQLAAEGYATYAVDLRGYGQTPRDETGWLTPDRAEADVAAVLAWVRTQRPEHARVALLGWSLGSLVGQLVAQRHPEALSAVVLYGYPRDPDRHYPKDPGEAQPPRKATTAAAAAEDFRVPGSISAAGIEAFVAQALAADPVRMDWRGSEQWNALDPAAVTVPTLLIHGEQDPYAPVASQAKLFVRLSTPDRQWVIVPGGDHAAHLEDTHFVAAVRAFVER